MRIGSITFERPIAGLQVEQQSTPFFYDGFQLPGIDLNAASLLLIAFAGLAARRQRAANG